MITNERQYRITKAEAERFEEALAHADDRDVDLHPRLKQAMREGLESQLEDLRRQLAHYQELRSEPPNILSLNSLDEIPDALITARIAAGLTQRELAQRIGIKEQQIQRYEATRYQSAKFARMQAVADALGRRIEVRAPLGDAAGNSDRTR